jgi:hypothetical protein
LLPTAASSLGTRSALESAMGDQSSGSFVHRFRAVEECRRTILRRPTASLGRSEKEGFEDFEDFDSSVACATQSWLCHAGSSYA